MVLLLVVNIIKNKSSEVQPADYPIVEKSYERIKYAIKENLNTGWFSIPENTQAEKYVTSLVEEQEEGEEKIEE